MSVWSPGVASQSRTHWTQVASEIGRDSRASLQAPSTATSTLEMPRSGAQAIPAMGTRPAATPAPPGGVSIRDCVRIGASFDQPRGTQYASNDSSVVSSSSASHLVADT